MNSDFFLSKSIAKNFVREKTIVFLLVFLPILLIFSASATVPDKSIVVILEDTRIVPDPNAKAVSVVLYSLTAVGFVASIASFFLNHQLKKVRPRLRMFGYSPFQIGKAYFFFAAIISILVTVSVVLMSMIYISPESFLGFVISMVVGAVIFSTIGLVLSSLLKSKELGLYFLLTTVLLDTGFVEHPFYSRQYDNPWLITFPAHFPVRMILRSAFSVGSSWIEYLLPSLLYELVLLVFFVLILKYKK